MALGARPGQVRRAVLRHAAGIGLAGMAAGIPGALGGGRLLEAAVSGVSARDPLVLVAVVLVLGAVMLAAGYVPARSASRVDPLEALRTE